MSLLKRFFREEKGATAVEYSIMVAAIAIVIVVAVQLIGTSLNNVYETFLDEMGWD